MKNTSFKEIEKESNVVREKERFTFSSHWKYIYNNGERTRE